MKRLLTGITFLLAFAFLGACATQPGQSSTPAVTVYQVEGNYAAALQVAIAYKNLPRCGLPTSPVLCSKAEVIKKLQDADDVAYPLLKAAQSIVTAPGAGVNAQTAINAANQAVIALTAITATLASN